ncbi:hypothetical protein ABLE91_20075 [Aquabacter sp. CN5-332]|uniref:hypothetical protein n=1 Tax=Aquabacter sp. CN5-332 TaxID=3156608 RepID=UPI0032B3DC4B
MTGSLDGGEWNKLSIHEKLDQIRIRLDQLTHAQNGVRMTLRETNERMEALRGAVAEMSGRR